MRHNEAFAPARMGALLPGTASAALLTANPDRSRRRGSDRMFPLSKRSSFRILPVPVCLSLLLATQPAWAGGDGGGGARSGYGGEGGSGDGQGGGDGFTVAVNP